ncbi:hypothetical protein C0992_006746 [Termitomyces sp. T32_za158]|nr:hypothetical protein C0992_006746 [Termitomyces sp. T32_za158]
MRDNDVASILNTYSGLSYQPPSGQYTVAASFCLLSASTSPKVISIATGTKCLPTSRYPLKGEALLDNHAEILARRGAIRWFLLEVLRSSSDCSGAYESPWIERRLNERFKLKEGGDASMRILAMGQDREMAALKNSSIFAPLGENETSRGRDNYARLGVLRTKPGRADSPSTMCMACSDKIASWSVLGFQGALATRFIEPLYLSSIVIGEVPLDVRDIVREDCDRALWKRIGSSEDWPPGYSIHVPAIVFTDQPFIHSRTVIETVQPSRGSCNEALSWVADTFPHEFLINGIKRGVSPKHRFREKSRPSTSRIAMLHLYNRILEAQKLPPLNPSSTYHESKMSMMSYQAAKEKLIGKDGAFSGWVRSGAKWQNFALSQSKDDLGGIATPEITTD